jgi:Ca2+:H+ antiporter
MLKRVSWTVVVPVLALVALALTWGGKIGTAPALLEAVLLGGAVMAAVHHAEVVAHRVGEPFGSLLLAAAVTVIEWPSLSSSWPPAGTRRRLWPETPCSRLR